MSSSARFVGNALIPGSALVVAGCWWRGLGVLIPAIIIAGAMPVLALLLQAEAWARAWPVCAAAYVGLAMVATLLLWWRSRRPTIDEAAVRRCHREVSAAWLQGDDEKARREARQLVRMQPRLAGAWRLLATIGTDGDRRQAARHLRELEEPLH